MYYCEQYRCYSRVSGKRQGVPLGEGDSADENVASGEAPTFTYLEGKKEMVEDNMYIYMQEELAAQDRGASVFSAGKG